MPKPGVGYDDLTPQQKKIVDVLRRGEPHQWIGADEIACQIKSRSAKSVHVQINRLRGMGYDIESNRKKGPGGRENEGYRINE